MAAIGPDALAARAMIKRIERGDLPATPTLDLASYGAWGTHVQSVFDAYSKGFKTRLKKGGMDSAKRLVDRLITSDKNFAAIMVDDAQPEETSAMTARVPALITAKGKDHTGYEYDVKPLVGQPYNRKVRQFLDEYVDHSNSWSPRGFEGFHEALGLIVMAVVAAGRVRIPIQRGRPTSLYIMLAAESSTYAKSSTADVARAALEDAGLAFLLHGQAKKTPQSYYRDGSGYIPEDYATQSDEEQKYTELYLRFAGQRSFLYDEFGSVISSIAQQSGIYRDWLDIYLQVDNGRAVGNEVVSRGSEYVRNPYITLAANLPPSNIHTMAPKQVGNLWGSGLFPRFAFITPPRGTFSMAPMKLGMITTPQPIIDTLLGFHERLGDPDFEPVEKFDKNDKPTGEYKPRYGHFPVMDVKLTDEAHDAFEHYGDSLRLIANTVEGIPRELRPAYERFADKALRIAALFAALEMDGVMTLDCWLAAQEIAERWRVGLHEFRAQIEEEPDTQQRKREDNILKHLVGRTWLRSFHIAQKCGISTEEASRVLDAMYESSAIQRIQVHSGKGGNKTAWLYGGPHAPLPEEYAEPSVKEQLKVV